MLDVIYAHETWGKGLPSIFFAGPSPRNEAHHDWRPEGIKVLEDIRFPGAAFIPLPRDGNWLDNYDAQIEWELEYLFKATVVAFWIPRDLKDLPGFTTNVEYGIFWKSGKFVLGYPKEAVKMKYLDYLARKVSAPVRHTLRDTLMVAADKALQWPLRSRLE